MPTNIERQALTPVVAAITSYAVVVELHIQIYHEPPIIRDDAVAKFRIKGLRWLAWYIADDTLSSDET
jgi:hypothetical protein